MTTQHLIQAIICCSILTTMACSDKENDTAEPTDSGDVQDTGDTIEDPVNCAALSTDECSENSLCQTINGTPQIPDDEDACFNPGDSTAVGCMDVDMMCDEL